MHKKVTFLERCAQIQNNYPSLLAAERGCSGAEHAINLSLQGIPATFEGFMN